MENPNPVVFEPLDVAALKRTRKQGEPQERDPIDALEVYEMIRHINDPEHPLTLEQLKVVEPGLIKVDDEGSTVDLLFTPTIRELGVVFCFILFFPPSTSHFLFLLGRSAL